MHDPGQLDDQQAAQRRRVWLDGRHRWNRDLVVVLLRYAPEIEITRALDRLSAGELHQLARLLVAATDLHQVARRIAADLRKHPEGRPTEPSASEPGPPRGDPAAPMTGHGPP